MHFVAISQFERERPERLGSMNFAELFYGHAQSLSYQVPSAAAPLLLPAPTA